MDGAAGEEDVVGPVSRASGSRSLIELIEASCRTMAAQRAIDGAGCSLLDRDLVLRPVTTVGVSARSLAAAEELLGDGPCHDALVGVPGPVGPVGLTAWPPLRSVLAASPSRAVVATPIVHDGTRVGVFFVVSDRERPWSDRSLDATAAAAADIGRALDAAIGALDDDAVGRDGSDDEVVRRIAGGLVDRGQLDQATNLIARHTASTVGRSRRRLQQLADGLDVPAITVAKRIIEHGRLPGPDELLADASERSHREELARLALTDPLTGLANRVLFLDRLEHAVWRSKRGAGRAAVLYIDLDGFKLVNDSLGHDTGDQVLCTAAARIQASVRPQDTVGRMGGDEFAVVCESVEDAPAALEIARRIARAVEEPIATSRSSGLGQDDAATTSRISASIGIAVAEPGQPADEVLHAADAAMYRSKVGTAHITVSGQAAGDTRRTGSDRRRT